MKRLLAGMLAGGLLIASLPAVVAVAQDDAIDETETLQILFVLSGTSGSVDGDLLTLVGVPSVIAFGDRPARFAGHLEVADLATIWESGADSLAVDPPNAVLATLGHDEVEDTVIELTDVAVDAAGVHFGFTELLGTLSQGAFGTASLFIDGVRGCTGPEGTQDLVVEASQHGGQDRLCAFMLPAEPGLEGGASGIALVMPPFHEP